MTEVEFRERLAQTRFVVEAACFERVCLWRELHGHHKIEQLYDGTAVIIGEFGGMPVNLSLCWWRVDGILVMFWEAVSAVTNLFMARDWLSANCAPRWDRGLRPARTDAMNFHWVLDHVREVNAGVA